MGTIAARDALRVLTLTEQVAAAHVVTARQAVFLKVRSGSKVPAGVLKLAEQMGVEPLIEDLVLEPELRGLIARMPALGKL